MHDSEFERQVQQRMEELKFAPGSDVWTRVQADIQKKKRRRPVILWFLLAGLLVGGSWILYTGVFDSGRQDMQAETTLIKEKNVTGTGKQTNEAESPLIDRTNETSDTEKNKISSDNKQTNTSPDTKKITASPDNETVSTGPGTKKPNASAGIAKANKPVDTKKTDGSSGQDQSVIYPDNRKTNNPAPELIDQTAKQANDQPEADKSTLEKPDVAKTSVEKSTPVRPVQTSETNTGSPVSRKEDVAITKENVSKEHPTSKKDEAAITKDETVAKKNEPTAKDESIAKKDEAPPVKKDESVAMKNKQQKKANAGKTNWQFGITAGAGISDLGRQLFKPTTVADFALSNTNPMSPGPNAPSRRPSEVQAGTAWHAGAFVSRNIGKKLALKLGLNYELYSNSIKVGTQVNSARFVNQGTDMKMVEEYYTLGTTTNYENKYQDVLVPLTLQWKVFDRKKYGIVWENGVSASRLINTTALHFDGISGTYYKDDEIFKKTQVMLSSSVLFTIKSKNNLQLYAGPQVQYGISNLVNQDAGNNRHLRYAGLKLMAGFNKK